jgi:hypothetical protein
MVTKDQRGVWRFVAQVSKPASAFKHLQRADDLEVGYTPGL